MSKNTELFEYMRTCPQLADLWSIGATEDEGVNVILPNGSSQLFSYNERMDTLGNYECDIIPNPSVFEDYQINCYKFYDTNDRSSPEYNRNVMSYDDVQAICDWIAEQNRIRNLPQITGEQVVSIEPIPRTPQIRYVNRDESSICYFVSFRVRYVNKEEGISVEYER